jgi:hypothetical protein
MVKQLSVFLENTKGRLSQMTKVLQDAQIDLLALSIADTTNFGILRAIVSDDDKAVAELKEAGYTVNLNEVIAVGVPDHPGGLSEVLDVLVKNNVSVEYLYSFVRKPKEKALIIFKVDDVPLAVKALSENNVTLLSRDDLLKL